MEGFVPKEVDPLAQQKDDTCSLPIDAMKPDTSAVVAGQQSTPPRSFQKVECRKQRFYPLRRAGFGMPRLLIVMEDCVARVNLVNMSLHQLLISQSMARRAVGRDRSVRPHFGDQSNIGSYNSIGA